MAKKIFEIKIECLQSNKGKGRSNIMLANEVKQEERGATARDAININVKDTKLAGLMDPEKKYTVTITEE